MKKTPLEILEGFIDLTAMLDSGGKRWPRPGQVITDLMRAEQREVLKNLKSEDISNLRPDSIWLS